MRKAIPLLIAAFAFAPHLTMAQKPSTEASVVLTSEAGKAALVSTAQMTATVVAIDKGTRTVTLKGSEGRTLDVVAGDEVKNFAQIRIGDSVVALYQEALTLELKKVKAPGGSATETATVARARPGERPAGLAGRQVTVLADVVAVDPKNSIISLRGPQGKVVDLKVRNQDHFKVVNVGDQVEAVYSEALAVAVTPAPKAAGKE
jgi:hypothetical protein